MKRYFVVAAIIISGCANQQNQQDPRQEILRLLEIQELAYDNQSKENKNKFIETCTDSLWFIGGDDGGMLVTPKAYVEDFGDGYIKKPYDKKIQVYDNAVLVTSLHQAFKKLSNDSLLLNARMTKTFVKQDGKWKMACVAYAPLAVVYNKTTTLDPKIFTKYIGIYDVGGGVRDSVYVDNGKLFWSGTEMFALNDSTFIGQGYFGKTIFGKSHYTFEWNDGQRIRFNKIR